MYINLTFFLQTINFLSTFWFLNRFLFAPFIASLEKKEKKEKNLSSSVMEEMNLVEKLKKEKKETLIAFQEHVKKTYHVPASVELTIEANVPFEKLAEKEKLTEEITNVLVKKVSYEFE